MEAGGTSACGLSVHFQKGDQHFCFQEPSPSTLRKPKIPPSSVQFGHSVVSDSATSWTAARQASLSITISRSLPKLMSIESVRPSNHLILCCLLLLLPSIFPSIRVFSNKSALHIRWPKHWSLSFKISPFNEHSGLISFRMDWLDLRAIQGTLKSLLQHHSSKASILQIYPPDVAKFPRIAFQGEGLAISNLSPKLHLEESYICLQASQMALVGKNPAANTGDIRDTGSIPGSGRSPGGGGHGNPLQYPCLEAPMHRGAWRATVHGVE